MILAPPRFLFETEELTMGTISETREILVYDTKPRLMALPLALLATGAVLHHASAGRGNCGRPPGVVT